MKMGIGSFRLGLMALLIGVSAAPMANAATLVIYGASGSIGGVITKEALSRGHTVIGVSRHPEKLKFNDKNFKAAMGDVTDVASFKAVTAGADAVIISVVGNSKDKLPENTVQARAAKVAVEVYSGAPNGPHVIQIGGASTIYETKEAMEAHLPFFAKIGSSMSSMVFGHLVALQTYRASHIRWTVLTPPEDIDGWSMAFAPRLKRTGKYRTSTTELVKDANGKSTINIADLAVAAVDEAEHPRFVGQRFTVGY